MTAAQMKFGDQLGETCWRNGCQGVIAEHERGDCSCHIAPPCSACTEHREFCPTCDWHAKDDHGTFNDHVVKYAPNGVFESFKPRPLDPRKLDYRNLSHSNSSMVKEGVYPPGMTQAEVLAEVQGTFGGRFEYFKDGKFRYIAYTD